MKNEVFENALSALTDFEEQHCNCDQLTTSSVFWLGDYRPSCLVVSVITNMEYIND